MLIGNKEHTAGNRTRYEVDYENWLDDGRVITTNAGFSAALIAGSTVSDIVVNSVSATSHRLYFFVSGGTVNETFTLQVQITDSLGEIVVDTINFTVVAP